MSDFEGSDHFDLSYTENRRQEAELIEAERRAEAQREVEFLQAAEEEEKRQDEAQALETERTDIEERRGEQLRREDEDTLTGEQAGVIEATEPEAEEEDEFSFIGNAITGIAGGIGDLIDQTGQAVVDVGGLVDSGIDVEKITDNLTPDFLEVDDRRKEDTGHNIFRTLSTAVAGMALGLPLVGMLGKAAAASRAFGAAIAGVRSTKTGTFLTGEFGKALAAGSLVDALAFDPQSDRLANMAEGSIFENDVTQWLSHQEGDSDLEGRIKNAIEGGVLGSIADLAFRGVRAMWKAKASNTKMAAEQVAPQFVKKSVVLQSNVITSRQDLELAQITVRTLEADLAKTGDASITAARAGRVALAEEMSQVDEQITDAMRQGIPDDDEGLRSLLSRKEELELGDSHLNAYDLNADLDDFDTYARPFDDAANAKSIEDAGGADAYARNQEALKDGLRQAKDDQAQIIENAVQVEAEWLRHLDSADFHALKPAFKADAMELDGTMGDSIRTQMEGIKEQARQIADQPLPHAATDASTDGLEGLAQRSNDIPENRVLLEDAVVAERTLHKDVEVGGKVRKKGEPALFKPKNRKTDPDQRQHAKLDNDPDDVMILDEDGFPQLDWDRLERRVIEDPHPDLNAALPWQRSMPKVAGRAINHFIKQAVVPSELDTNSIGRVLAIGRANMSRVVTGGDEEIFKLIDDLSVGMAETKPFSTMTEQSAKVEAVKILQRDSFDFGDSIAVETRLSMLDSKLNSIKDAPAYALAARTMMQTLVHEAGYHARRFLQLGNTAGDELKVKMMVAADQASRAEAIRSGYGNVASKLLKSFDYPVSGVEMFAKGHNFNLSDATKTNQTLAELVEQFSDGELYRVAQAAEAASETASGQAAFAQHYKDALGPDLSEMWINFYRGALLAGGKTISTNFVGTQVYTHFSLFDTAYYGVEEAVLRGNVAGAREIWQRAQAQGTGMIKAHQASVGFLARAGDQSKKVGLWNKDVMRTMWKNHVGIGDQAENNALLMNKVGQKELTAAAQTGMTGGSSIGHGAAWEATTKRGKVITARNLENAAKRKELDLDQKFGTKGAGGRFLPQGGIRRAAWRGVQKFAASTYGGKAIDAFGGLVQSPLTILGTTDSYIKQINYDGAMGLRATELGQAEGLVDLKLQNYVDYAQNHAHEWETMKGIDEKLRGELKQLDELATVHAETFTFTSPHPKGSRMEGFAKWSNGGIITQSAMPFSTTPPNLVREAGKRNMLTRTFTAEYKTLVQAAKSGKKFDIDNLNAYNSRARSGTAILSLVAYGAHTGMITGSGPANPDARRALLATGWKPNSIRFQRADGSHYYVSYNRAEPAALPFGVVADLMELIPHIGDKAGTEIGADILASVINNLRSKTYLSGVANMVDALSNPEQKLLPYIHDLGAAFIPTVVGDVARKAGDDAMRETETMLQGMMAKIPGLADNLPPKRNVFGEVIYYPQGIGPDMLSPFQTSESPNTIVNREFKRLIEDHGFKLSMNGYNNVGGIPLTMEEKDRFIIMSTGDPSRNSSTLRVAIERLMRSSKYRGASDLPDGKQKLIKDLISKRRSRARRLFLRENKRVSDLLREDRELRRSAKYGGGSPVDSLLNTFNS